MKSKIIKLLTMVVSLAGSANAQQVRTEENVPPAPIAADDVIVDTDPEEDSEGEPRNPFVAASGVTNKSYKLVRDSLNVTKILGIIHTSEGGKMAVLKIGGQLNPLFVRVGSTFSVKAGGSREWRDVEVTEITRFEVIVTPKGVDGKIIIR